MSIFEVQYIFHVNIFFYMGHNVYAHLTQKKISELFKFSNYFHKQTKTSKTHRRFAFKWSKLLCDVPLKLILCTQLNIQIFFYTLKQNRWGWYVPSPITAQLLILTIILKIGQNFTKQSFLYLFINLRINLIILASPFLPHNAPA